ncbi:MAG: hypothetical protein ACJAWF_003757 [Candidatus Azotimanducaceae bacterium]|jgi:hypothetical protein
MDKKWTRASKTKTPEYVRGGERTRALFHESSDSILLIQLSGQLLIARFSLFSRELIAFWLFFAPKYGALVIYEPL